MAVNDLYILPEDVQLLPVKELPAQASSKFEYEEDDFVVTYTNARNTSKVIDAASAALLKEFRAPKSLPEGVFTYSMLNNLDAAKTMDGAYPMLVRLRKEGFLVAFDGGSQEQKAKVYGKGDKFKQYEIVAKLAGPKDTEIYKVKYNNANYALKLLKSTAKDQALLAGFYNEIEILEKLDGGVNPRLVESGEFEQDHYMVMDWVDGENIVEATERYRNLSDSKNMIHMLNTAINVLGAYSHLHSQGIIHSDIHPGNILVSEKGEVRIIDFGLSRLASDEKYIARGGVSFFFEPEYAHAILNKKQPPVSSFAGEQYALGALVYQLFTGKQYLDFSYDQEKLYTQIAQNDPIPFLNFDMDTAADVEAALLKALSKNPSDRFASVHEFYGELTMIKNGLLNKGRDKKRLSNLVYNQSLKDQYGFSSKFLAKGLQQSPTSNVNFGAAGIAYMYLRMAQSESDANLLSLADIWSDRALGYIHNYERSFYSKEMDLVPETVGATSIYHTESGVHLVQAMISKEMGDHHSFLSAVRNFMIAVEKPCDSLDLTLGKSASLMGCALLYDTMRSFIPGMDAELLALGKKITKEIWDVLDSYSAIGEDNPIRYRGIAHGWAGILYATLKWKKTSGQSLPANFFQRVDELSALGIEEGDSMRWNISNDEPVAWTGWCHGSAGYTFFWTLLYNYTTDIKYLTMAEKTVQYFLKASEPKIVNGSLCCGKSGEGYALLNIYNATGNEYYYNEARKMGKKLLPDMHAGQMKNHSLYKGNVGAGVFLAELEQPAYAKMPLFE